jgi:hypothetical protein
MERITRLPSFLERSEARKELPVKSAKSPNPETIRRLSFPKRCIIAGILVRRSQQRQLYPDGDDVMPPPGLSMVGESWSADRLEGDKRSSPVTRNRRPEERGGAMKINITPIKTLLLAGAFGVATILIGCQTAHPLASPAVTCSKCKTVWVKRPYNEGSAKTGTRYVLRDEKVMRCPDCESLVETFFKTGKLKHRCVSCGGTLDHCLVH